MSPGSIPRKFTKLLPTPRRVSAYVWEGWAADLRRGFAAEEETLERFRNQCSVGYRIP